MYVLNKFAYYVNLMQWVIRNLNLYLIDMHLKSQRHQPAHLDLHVD